jgi:ArsR family transcriptional regulator
VSELLHQLKALADETRLRLVNVLLGQELIVKELVSVLEVGQSRVSRHLKILSEAGLLASRKDGLKVFYRVAQSGSGLETIEAIRNRLQDDEIHRSDRVRAQQAIQDRAVATRRFFDSIADQWKSMRHEILGDVDLEAEVLAHMPRSNTAADLGCGVGDMIEALLTRSETVIGVDSSHRMLDMTRDRFPDVNGRLSLRIGQIEHLPLKDGEADFMVISMALHHLSHPLDGLIEAHRTVAPGGRVAIIDFEKHDREELRTRYGDHWLGFRPDRLEGWVTEAGLHVIETTSIDCENGLKLQLIMAQKTNETDKVKQ